MRSITEIIEEFKNMEAGRKAMKEINLVDEVLDGLENGDFIDTRKHLNREDLDSYMVACDYDINEMTNRENRDLLPDVYSHLKSCPECYNKVERAGEIIMKRLYNMRVEEARRN